jgi:uncharacterized coiled-coil protein SlyX
LDTATRRILELEQALEFAQGRIAELSAMLASAEGHIDAANKRVAELEKSLNEQTDQCLQWAASSDSYAASLDLMTESKNAWKTVALELGRERSCEITN